MDSSTKPSIERDGHAVACCGLQSTFYLPRGDKDLLLLSLSLQKITVRVTLFK